jgi:hypothetical protein
VTLSQVITNCWKKGDTLGELVKCKPSKIYHTIKNSYQVRHVRPPGQTCPAPRADISGLLAFSWVNQAYLPPSQIPETLTGHVQPPGQTCPASQPFSRVNQAYSASRPDSESIFWTCPAPSLDMSDLTKFPQRLSLGPDISGPQAGLQRGGSDIFGARSRHVRVSGTPTAIFGCPRKIELSGFENRTIRFSWV